MKKNNIFSKVFLWSMMSIASAPLFISCDNDYKEGAMGEAKLINDLKINIPNNFKLAIGMDFQTVYSILPEDATDQLLVWKSSNENVATVSQNGHIQTKELGETYLNITPSTTFNAVKSIFLTVVPKATSINVAAIEMFEGTSLVLTDNVVVQPQNGYKENVECTIGDHSILSFENGKLKALKSGTTSITIKTIDGSNLTATTTVSVSTAIPVEKIEIASNQEFAITDNNFALKFTLTPSNATIQTLIWESSDKSIATVNSEGKISAHNFGSVEIKAKLLNGNEAKTTITIVKGKINDFGNGLSIYTFRDNNATGAVVNGKLTIRFPQKQATNIVRDGVDTYVDADTYPILAIKTQGVEKRNAAGYSDAIWHNFDFYTPVKNQKFNMVWDRQLNTNDGNHVYYIDFATAFNGDYIGKGPQKATRFWFQTGYDRVLSTTNTLDVYWIKTFKSMQELQSFIDNE